MSFEDQQIEDEFEDDADDEAREPGDAANPPPPEPVEGGIEASDSWDAPAE